MAQDLHTRALQGTLLDARTDRLVNDILTSGLLFDNTDFLVNSTPSPSMNIRVGSGVAGDRYAVAAGRQQGTFIVRLDAPHVDLAIGNGDPSFDRIDGIDLVVWDDEHDSSGRSEAELVVTQGTPAASPQSPAMPSAAATRLAWVTVPAGESTSIGAGQIADRRVLTNFAQLFDEEPGPKGEVAYRELTGAGAQFSTTETDLITHSFTAEAGRVYRITAHVRIQQHSSSTDQVCSIRLRDNQTSRQDARRLFMGDTTNYWAGDIISRRTFTTAGTVNLNLTGQRTAGTANISRTASAGSPAFILVEDIGAA